MLETSEQLLALIDQLLIAIQKRFESLIKFPLINLRQILQQALITRDLLLGGLQLVQRGEMLLFLICVVRHHQTKAKESRLTDLNRWPSLYKSAALPLS